MPEEKPCKISWTLETLYQHLKGLIEEADKRYEQRFIAQEKAVGTAMVAQDKAVQAALTAQEKAVTAAMSAANLAVDKAERAVGERLAGMNEFRSALSDQTSNYMPRIEIEQRLGNLADKNLTINSRVDEIGTRMTKMEGQGSGASSTWNWIMVSIVALAAVMMVVIAVAAIIAAWFHK